MENLQGNMFNLSNKDKMKYFIPVLETLHEHHKNNCKEYKKICDNIDNKKHIRVEDFPFLPVRLFKELSLMSVPENDIKLVLKSSGTTGAERSKIYLDNNTSKKQSVVLDSLFANRLGLCRRPMIIIDSEKPLDLKNLTASEIGLLGFKKFGKDYFYALDNTGRLKLDEFKEYITKHKNEPLLIFGLTSYMWEYLYMELSRLKALKRFCLPKYSVILHGGGWKKIKNRVSQKEFDIYIKNIFYNSEYIQVVNYYGMVEQTGSIFLQCEKGFFHTSIYSDIIFRDTRNLTVSNKGLIELISLIPYSYPGHVILTEDIGHLIGIDNCGCGRLGKAFVVEGRLKDSEPRGCSDVR